MTLRRSTRCTAKPREAPHVGAPRSCAANARADRASSARGCAPMPPRAVVTCARGSSDHAATFAQYLIETRARRADLLGRAVGELGLRRAAGPARRAVPRDLAVGQESRPARRPPTRRRRPARWSSRWCNADGLAARRAAPTSPCRCAPGPRRSVAATKSYIASLSGDRCSWSPTGPSDRALLARAATPLPELLDARLGAATGAPRRRPRCSDARNLYVRRPRLRPRRRAGGGAQAQGNLRPARRGVQRGRGAARADGAGAARIPGAAVRQDDETAPAIDELAAELVARGAAVLIAGARGRAARCRCRRSPAHPADRADAA